ncbi:MULTISPECIES: hypothetical protein [Variovorax]|jgi:hypothetical protein|uniref:hypothetical protein n=1 Tax=Variovorax TaxID=34072 RepID=UPI00086A15BF|nr:MULTISPECIES: hypothetical protein [Variovorax]MBN8755455.1 hypothetical protein [Variovorax sp.]ODU14090.1 MAG: hypothetical protein ABS94_24180 [Variovorax sp. SCN 67-85]ODV22840.1 MAG: hypothetical protein ABT25_20785 [Variovorax sp. SCN 67-20]OJZ12566.1 MAG: hypothetical protein BGP22_31835 [Variovorax sp. 67-131]UKI09305.1 hypothetical protein L3V85_05440 [Variovorax paradoxus]
MPIPVVVWGVLELVALAITIHELGELAEELYDGVKKYGTDIEKAKEEVRKVIQSIKDEIARKIEDREEVAILLALAAADPQGQNTRKATGRGAGETTINAAIEQKIPFRDAISKVCVAADRMPVLSLRRKKGVSIKDLPHAKRKIIEELLAMSVEQLTDVELEEFFVIKLKQLAVNLLFEFVDECLDWASPLKCEEAFGPPPSYDDHPVEGVTRLKRLGTINPFYPSPYQYRKGGISADLVIQEYRHQKPDKGNIFAIVEIKFPGDRIEAKQLDAYQRMLDRAAKVKTERAPIRFQNKPVSSGGRLSLFRYPEDIAVHGHKESDKPAEHDKKEESKPQKSEHSSGKSRHSRKRGI